MYEEWRGGGSRVAGNEMGEPVGSGENSEFHQNGMLSQKRTEKTTDI